MPRADDLAVGVPQTSWPLGEGEAQVWTAIARRAQRVSGETDHDGRARASKACSFPSAKSATLPTLTRPGMSHLLVPGALAPFYQRTAAGVTLARGTKSQRVRDPGMTRPVHPPTLVIDPDTACSLQNGRRRNDSPRFALAPLAVAVTAQPLREW